MNTTPTTADRSHCSPLNLLIITLLLAGFGFASTANATAAAPYTWTGLSPSNSLYHSENWLDEITPYEADVGDEVDFFGLHLIFGDTRRTYIEYYELYASQLEFRGNTQGYYLEGDYDTTHIGSGGIIYNPAGDVRSVINDNIQLHASQIWNIQSGTLSIYGQISDEYYDGEGYPNGDFQIEKTGEGHLELDSYTEGGSWSGGLKLSAGTVTARVESSYDEGYDGYYADLSAALGNGSLIFNGGSLRTEQSHDGESSYADHFVLYNSIISKGLVSIKTDEELHIEQSGNIDDYFRLDADTLLRTSGAPIFINKDVTDDDGGHKLTIETESAIILSGSSSWTGGTQINKGVLIFGGEDNTPGVTDGITIGSLGYAGIGVDNNVGAFLDEVDLVNSTGTIGFDSDPDSDSDPDTFTTDVDLTGANASLRLGSATEAILGDPDTFTGGKITPQGDDYRFGGGGGSLYVASLLEDSEVPRNVVADSPTDAPLTIWLLNPGNDFSGSVSATHSAVIFGQGVPLPLGTANFITNTGGYIGTANDMQSVSGFMSHFAVGTTGIIGFDIFPTATEAREITDLDMSGFSSAYIGTASALRDEGGDVNGPGLELSGTIDPNSDDIHRFAAYKGGALEVSGTLTGNSMIIGTPDSIGTFGDPRHEEYSTVLISGDNNGGLAGGTTLYSGRLLVGQGAGVAGIADSSALGSGSLTVSPVSYIFGDDDEPPVPLLATDEAEITIPNNIVLNGELNVGGDNDFTLSGNISGSGELYMGEDTDRTFALTLSAANTFTGGIHFRSYSSLELDSDTASGAGPLEFGHSGGEVYFNTANPIVHGLESEGAYADLNLAFDGARTLTLMQQENSMFRGHIHAEGESTIIMDGPGILRLDDAQLYSSGIEDINNDFISLEIKQGTIVFANNSSLSDGSVKLSGGSLALSGGNNFNRPVIVGTGSKLAGYGTYTSNVSIGNGAILSPGLQKDGGTTGAMEFYHLELDAGGVYEFNLQSPNFTDTIGQDFIKVYNPGEGSTLVINADSDHPFIIKVVSLDTDGFAGMLEGIDQGHGLYSWTLINFDVISIPGNGDIFDPSAFSLDVSGFASDAPLGGEFNLFREGNNLMLGFTPVPEPSTYAMMILGLGMVGWTMRRRRHIK